MILDGIKIKMRVLKTGLNTEEAYRIEKQIITNHRNRLLNIQSGGCRKMDELTLALRREKRYGKNSLNKRERIVLKMSNWRAAKARKRQERIDAGLLEHEPKFVRAYRFEFGVREKVSGETAWHDLKSVRHAAKALGLVLKYMCLFLAVSAAGQANMDKRLWALSQIESGMNPAAIGRAGEVTEYQITPSALQGAKIPLSATLTRSGAKNAACSIIARRIGQFKRVHLRAPTDYEVGLLWHCPAAVGRPNAEQNDFATRFSNLCARKLDLPALPKGRAHLIKQRKD